MKGSVSFFVLSEENWERFEITLQESISETKVSMIDRIMDKIVSF
jgi:hypothetical protein